MKRNYVPAGMTCSPAQIAERNEYIDMLCAEIQPLARDVFESAVKRQTASESAEALAEEARAVLLEVLSESPEDELDEESHRLREALTDELKETPGMLDEKEDLAWIERWSKDLARAVVGFWVNLGEDEISRYEVSNQILDDLSIGRQSKHEQKFELIFSRFWLNRKEASKLLNYLDAGAVKRGVFETVEPSLKPANVEKIEISSEPSPEIIEILKDDPGRLVEHFFKDCHSPSCNLTRDYLRDVDRINRDQFERIMESMAFQEPRMESYRSNMAVVYGAVQTTADFLRAGPCAAQYSIRTASTRCEEAGRGRNV